MRKTKNILIAAVVAVGLGAAGSAVAVPPGYYSAYTNPYGYTYSHYVSPYRLNPASSYALPGTRSQFYQYSPGYGVVYGTRWIGYDGLPHANTYQATPWGIHRSTVRAVTR